MENGEYHIHDDDDDDNDDGSGGTGDGGMMLMVVVVVVFYMSRSVIELWKVCVTPLQVKSVEDVDYLISY